MLALVEVFRLAPKSWARAFAQARKPRRKMTYLGKIPKVASEVIKISLADATINSDLFSFLHQLPLHVWKCKKFEPD